MGWMDRRNFPQVNMRELRDLQLKCAPRAPPRTSNAMSCNRKTTGGRSWPVLSWPSLENRSGQPMNHRGKMAQEDRVPYTYAAPHAVTRSAQVLGNVAESRVSTAVVHLICNQGVGGSNPSPGTIFKEKT